MFNISLYTYVQIKRFGSHLSHHQCEMLEENLTQVTGYATAHILQTIQVLTEVTNPLPKLTLKRFNIYVQRIRSRIIMD